MASMRILTKPWIKGLLLVGVLLAACSAAGSGQRELEDTRWHLVAIDDREVAEYLQGYMATIQFTDGEAGGSAGCNSYGGNYLANSGSGTISFSEVHSTLMACEDETVMQIEADFLEALNDAGLYEIEGNTLRIIAGETTLVFFRAR